MHPRAAAAIIIAISAFLLASAAAPIAWAQTAPRSAWTMPTTVNAPAYSAAAPVYSNAPSYAPSPPAVGAPVYRNTQTYASVPPAAAPVYNNAPAYNYTPVYSAPPAYRSAPASLQVTRAAPPARESALGPKPKPRDYHFDLGVGTEIPISVGGVLIAELPHRFLLQLGAGVMPRAYAEGIDSFLTSVGAYNVVVSEVVRGSLSNSAVVRASIGGRPFADHGFEVLVGYTLIAGGGSVATTDIVNAILADSGASFQVPPGFISEVPVSATLHNFHASIGWRWLLADDRLVLRASLSYFQTVSANVDVKLRDAAPELISYQGLVNDQVNGYLGPFFSKYAKAPTLGLSAAVRF